MLSESIKNDLPQEHIGTVIQIIHTNLNINDNEVFFYFFHIFLFLFLGRRN